MRDDFPILSRKIHGKPLVYLDNAASTQKPRAVLDAFADCYGGYYANVHRGVHTLSQLSTEACEQARRDRAAASSAPSAPDEIVFVRGTTEAINLVAQSWGRQNVGPGDEILISGLEHHSNIVPWQALCERQGARLRVVPLDDRGEVILEEFERLLSERTRMVAVAHVSNALGTINPVREIADMAHRRGALVLVDGAQAVPHLPVDVRALGCDFYAFSGHKVYGPSGIGALYGRADLLEAMPPWQTGGGMIHPRDLREDHLRAAAAPLRGRHARHRRRDRARRRARLRRRRRPAGHRRPGVASCSPMPRSASGGPRPAASSAPRRTRRPSSPSPWTASIRTTSAPSSTRRGSPSAPATTARSR